MFGFGATGQFAIGEIGTGAAETITPDKWFQALGEPIRFRQGLMPPAQQAFAFNPQPFVSFSWFEALAEPVRALPRSPAALYPNFFFQPAPSPFVATGWFVPLSEPVRFRPALKVGEQQFLAYRDNPLTVTPFAWFAPLSEPVRFKPGLRAALQQFFATDTSVIPLQTGLMPWYMMLGEPVRFLPGLKAVLQQFFAAPSQLRPTPTSTGVLNALETKDVFLSGASVFNRPTSAEMGISTKDPQAQMGVAQATGGLTAKMSISIL